MNYVRFFQRSSQLAGRRWLGQTQKLKSIDSSRFTLADGSILLCQCDTAPVYRAFAKKLKFPKMLCLLVPFFLVWLERSDFEWSTLYYELHDYYFGSGHHSDDVQYVWDGMTVSFVNFLTYAVIAYIFYATMKGQLQKIYTRFCTHIFYNEKRRSILFRSTNQNIKHAHWIEVPVNSVKFMCGDYNAPDPRVFQGPFKGGDDVNGSIYHSQNGYTHVVATEGAHEVGLGQQIVNGIKNNQQAKFQEGDVIFYVRNSALADKDLFNECFQKFDFDGDHSIISLESTTGHAYMKR